MEKEKIESELMNYRKKYKTHAITNFMKDNEIGIFSIMSILGGQRIKKGINRNGIFQEH